MVEGVGLEVLGQGVVGAVMQVSGGGEVGLSCTRKLLPQAFTLFTNFRGLVLMGFHAIWRQKSWLVVDKC